jgi:hypothetical protein
VIVATDITEQQNNTGGDKEEECTVLSKEELLAHMEAAENAPEMKVLKEITKEYLERREKEARIDRIMTLYANGMPMTVDDWNTVRASVGLSALPPLEASKT